MSLTPTATATEPPPANSPTMHSRMGQLGLMKCWGFVRQNLPKTVKKEPNIYFFHAVILDHFQAKISKSETTSLPLLFPGESKNPNLFDLGPL